MTRDSLSRFLGGSPGQVVLRLIFLSFVVGIILSALNLDPISLVYMVRDFIHRLWYMGSDAIVALLRYLAIGAVIVVPLWFLGRLLSVSKR